jgi:hypothetical protein
VRATVEETLNALLDAEADHLCGARKYERTEGRKDTRAGSYDRQLHTKAGEDATDAEAAEPAVRRDMAEAELRRRGEERQRVGGDRGGAERLPADPGGERRSQGGQGELDGVPARLAGMRVEGGRVVRLRQVSGAGGEPGRFLSRGEVAALRGSLLPQRLDGGAERQGEGGGGDAEGHLRPGRRRGGQGKARQVIEKLRTMRLAKAAEIVENGIGEMNRLAELVAIA